MVLTVVAADRRSPRDGKHIEVLGYYNPLPGQDGGKRMGLNIGVK
ncbi:putative ribosomal protein S16 [Helianthus anomalus]